MAPSTTSSKKQRKLRQAETTLSTPVVVSQTQRLLRFWNRGSGSRVRMMASLWPHGGGCQAISRAPLLSRARLSSTIVPSLGSRGPFKGHVQLKREGAEQRAWWEYECTFHQLSHMHFHCNANRPPKKTNSIKSCPNAQLKKSFLDERARMSCLGVFVLWW